MKEKEEMQFEIQQRNKKQLIIRWWHFIVLEFNNSAISMYTVYFVVLIKQHIEINEGNKSMLKRYIYIIQKICRIL